MGSPKVAELVGLLKNKSDELGLTSDEIKTFTDLDLTELDELAHVRNYSNTRTFLHRLVQTATTNSDEKFYFQVAKFIETIEPLLKEEDHGRLTSHILNNKDIIYANRLLTIAHEKHVLHIFSHPKAVSDYQKIIDPTREERCVRYHLKMPDIHRHSNEMPSSSNNPSRLQSSEERLREELVLAVQKYELFETEVALLRRERSLNQSKYDALLRENAQILDAMSVLKAKNDTLNQQLIVVQQGLQHALQTITKENETSRSLLSQAQQEKDEIAEQLEALKSQFDLVQSKTDECSKLSQQIDELQAEKSALHTEIRRISSEKEALNTQFRDLSVVHETLKVSQQHLQSQLDSARKKNNQLPSILTALTRVCNDLASVTSLSRPDIQPVVTTSVTSMSNEQSSVSPPPPPSVKHEGIGMFGLQRKSGVKRGLGDPADSETEDKGYNKAQRSSDQSGRIPSTRR